MVEAPRGAAGPGPMRSTGAGDDDGSGGIAAAAGRDHRNDDYQSAVQASPLQVEVLPALEIKNGPSGERGVFAADAIPAGSVLVRVPFASLLTTESLRAIPALSPLLAADPPLREDDALAILLLHERGRGEASKWHAHIRILPEHVNNALHFDAAVLRRLGDSQLGLLARQLQQQARRDYAEVSRRPGLVLDEAGQGPGWTLLECAWWDWQGYLWALSMVFSRFVSAAAGPGDGRPLKAMAPFFDLLNHSSVEPPALAHGYAPALESLVVQSTAALPGGREVCLHYGPHSPLKLLMLYGFLPPRAQEERTGSDAEQGQEVEQEVEVELDRHAAVDVWVSTDPALPHYEAKARALAALGLPLAGSHAVTAREPVVGPALLATLRIQRAATAEELGKMLLAQSGALSAANERAALGALRGALEAMLAAVPPGPSGSGSGQGGQVGQGEPPSSLHGMVDRYLASERRVLRRALARVAELEREI